MTTVDVNAIQDDAKAFVKSNLLALSREMLTLYDTAVLPTGGKFRKLQALLAPITTSHSLSLAQSLVSDAVVRKFVAENSNTP